LLYALPLLVMAGAVMIYLPLSPSNGEASRSSGLHKTAPRHRLQVRGFHFEGRYEGKRVISIRSDRFTIEKKKLGFFSLGLMNTATFRNAVIDLYGRKKEGGRDGTPKGQTTPAMIFKGAFKKETLPAFPVKGVSSVVIEPVQVNLYHEDALIARIAASSATIGLRGREVLFEGDVLVVSGPRVLRTDRLMLLPDKGLLRTDRRFLLKTPRQDLVGDALTVDVLLTPLRAVSS